MFGVYIKYKNIFLMYDSLFFDELFYGVRRINCIINDLKDVHITHNGFKSHNETIHRH